MEKQVLNFSLFVRKTVVSICLPMNLKYFYSNMFTSRFEIVYLSISYDILLYCHKFILYKMLAVR